MRMSLIMKKIFKFNIKGLIFSGICTLLILVLSLVSGGWNPFSSLDNKISDSMYQHKDETVLEINIVGLDEATITKYGRYTPLKYRKYFADILNNWADNGIVPSAIGFDIIIPCKSKLAILFLNHCIFEFIVLIPFYAY